MKIDNANDAELLYAFLLGLKKRVHAKVRLHNFKMLDKAAHLALDFVEFLRP